MEFQIQSANLLPRLRQECRCAFSIAKSPPVAARCIEVVIGKHSTRLSRTNRYLSGRISKAVSASPRPIGSNHCHPAVRAIGLE